MKKIVLILGAGASVDYGYPLWEPLREQMLNLKIEEFLSEVGGINDREIIENHKLAHAEFSDLAKINSEFSLDKIISIIDQPKAKHLNPTGHLLINIAGLILAKIELNNHKKNWITEFQKILIEYLLIKSNPSNLHQNLLDNLTIISLNYDRVFEYFISHDFYKKLNTHPSYKITSASEAIKFSKNNNLKILKPHGYISMLGNQNNSSRIGMNIDLVLTGMHTIGTRYPGNDASVPYGDSRIISQDTILRMGRHMYVVDERTSEDYQKSNQCINNSEVVICLGLSDKGISQSRLDFRQVKNVYLSNKESDINYIREHKPGPSYLSLGKSGKRMNASEFPDLFTELCL